MIERGLQQLIDAVPALVVHTYPGSLAKPGLPIQEHSYRGFGLVEEDGHQKPLSVARDDVRVHCEALS